jgi:hypothetical protein
MLQRLHSYNNTTPVTIKSHNSILWIICKAAMGRNARIWKHLLEEMSQPETSAAKTRPNCWSDCLPIHCYDHYFWQACAVGAVERWWLGSGFVSDYLLFWNKQHNNDHWVNISDSNKAVIKKLKLQKSTTFQKQVHLWWQHIHLGMLVTLKDQCELAQVSYGGTW